jgi:hypothetical protein
MKLAGVAEILDGVNGYTRFEVQETFLRPETPSELEGECPS